MKLFLTLTLIILFTSISCSNKRSPLNCKKMKTGKFTGLFPMGGKQTRFNIIRNDSIQIETNEDNGAVGKLRISWPDDCTYKLKFISTTEKLNKDELYFREKAILTTRIVETTDMYYVFKTKADLVDMELTDTLWILPN